MEEDNSDQKIQSDSAERPIVVPFRKFWMTGFLVIGALLATSIFYAGWQYSQKQAFKGPSPFPILAPEPSITQSADPTTNNWKTYISSCSFSVKYPQEWNAQKYFIQDSNDSCVFITAPDYKQGSDTRSGFSITIARMSKGDTSVGTINTIDDYIKSIEATIQPSTSVANRVAKTYGSLTGIQFDFDAFESITTFIALQGNYFYIVRWPTIKQYSGSYITGVDQILSTFKFLDQNQAGNTTGWKIYKNEKYGFKVSYPSDMLLSSELQAPDSELLSSRSISRPEAKNFIGKGVIDIAVRSTPLDVLISNAESRAGSRAAEINLGRVKANKIEWVEDDRTNGIKLYTHKIFFNKNDLSYIISLYVDNESSIKQNLVQTFNQMLSALRFD
ncbi:hypothetical protein HY439_02645 [Candidatus Microgenomates bacterium]|nr:hypothetical protein [Candidatus Microgenomates bacterium]